MRALLDTSVLVPAVVDQIANHESALGALRRHGGGEHRGCCSTHALAECYATLAVLPLPSRVLPEQARLLVEESIGRRLEIIQLTSEDYLHALRLVAGGQPVTGCADGFGSGSSRYTRAAVSWKSWARSLSDQPAVSRLNEFHSTR